MSDAHYSVKAVSQRTGLSPHVLRVWERRYGAVTPERSETNRRLYSEEEVTRLEFLAVLTSNGHGISNIAGLPLSELGTMAAACDPVRPSRTEESPIEEAWSCIRDLDSAGLHATLDRAAISLGHSKLIHQVIVPLIERIGSAWEAGEISAAEEHAASAVVKEVPLSSSRPFVNTGDSPNLLVATPVGQIHELGAVLLVSIARRAGWEVTYLGPSLPAHEIARAAITNKSRAVALSIVYPGDDDSLPAELRELRKSLPESLPILAGGRCAPAYQKTLSSIGAEQPDDLNALRSFLESLRKPLQGEEATSAA